jgi:hypothetical protein
VDNAVGIPGNNMLDAALGAGYKYVALFFCSRERVRKKLGLFEMGFSPTSRLEVRAFFLGHLLGWSNHCNILETLID